MGMNFYLYAEPPCDKCGHRAEPLHIGKSSAGWCFSLHVIPEIGIDELEGWKMLWERQGAVIEDETGTVLTPDEMLDRILNRSWPTKEYTPQYLAENHAILGPNNLMRFKLDSRCVGHGDGTYDLIRGEFS